MEVYQGVAMTDGLNRKNHFIPLSTILKAYRDTWGYEKTFFDSVGCPVRIGYR